MSLGSWVLAFLITWLLVTLVFRVIELIVAAVHGFRRKLGCDCVSYHRAGCPLAGDELQHQDVWGRWS